MPVRKYRSVADMNASPAPGPTGAQGLRLACELSELAFGLRAWQFEPGVRRFRSAEEADRNRRQWEARHLRSATDWERDFEATARRPLQQRLRYAFVHTYKPVLDDAPYRSFDSMAEYREWCARNLPSWLGYGPAV